MENFKRSFWCFTLDINQETRVARDITQILSLMWLKFCCLKFVVRGFNIHQQTYNFWKKRLATMLLLQTQTRADNWTLSSKKESIFREWKIFWWCCTYVSFWVSCSFGDLLYASAILSDSAILQWTSSCARLLSCVDETQVSQLFTSKTLTQSTSCWKHSVAMWKSVCHKYPYFTSLCDKHEGTGVIFNQAHRVY